MSAGLLMTRRVRRTPYTDRVEAAGVRGFTVVNHMILPKAFATTVVEDYWHLRAQVQVWDVSCQRQIEISGPDAGRLAQWMTPRDLSGAAVGQCLYAPLTDARGGLVNDPVLLKLGEDRYRLSIADSDVGLWAEGLATGRGLDVAVREAAVYPLAVQGPLAEALMADVFGPAVRALRFFRFGWFAFQGRSHAVARSGFSKQGGFEIYVEGAEGGPALWDALFEAGRDLGVRAGCPNLIERIEGGLLSFGNDITRETTPLEIGLERFCALDGSIDFLGRAALQRMAAAGVTRRIRGVLFDGGPCPTCATPWPVRDRGAEGDAKGAVVGAVTSAIWSPRFQRNVGVALIDRAAWAPGRAVTVRSGDGVERPGEVAALPLAGPEEGLGTRE